MMAGLKTLSDENRDLLQSGAHPEWCAPMLATLTDDHFSDPDWIYERKLDGERALAFRDGDRVRLLTRNRKGLNATYPELVDAIGRQGPGDFVADGKIVTFDGDVSSFSRLEARMQIKDADTASEKGWEGLIAKRVDAGYRHARSTDWLKFKCVKGQELVIGGFTAPKGNRVDSGALLVGYYDDDEALRYSGKVGTGFHDDFLCSLLESVRLLVGAGAFGRGAFFTLVKLGWP